jgi:hypothetical protein
MVAQRPNASGHFSGCCEKGNVRTGRNRRARSHGSFLLTPAADLVAQARPACSVATALAPRHLTVTWSLPRIARAAAIAAACVAPVSSNASGAGFSPPHPPAAAAEAAPAEPSSTARTAQAVVAIVTHDPRDPSHARLCSGVLVEPNLVLTARHCVSLQNVDAPACDRYGRSHDGDQLSGDLDPKAIAVYAKDRIDLARDAPSAFAERTLHAGGRTLCDADIAYLVLDQPLAGIVPATLARALARQTVVTVGFGSGPADAGAVRTTQPAGRVLALGPHADPVTGKVLGPREIEIESATCSGDSGGPALDFARGEVIGVVSRGGCTLRGNHVVTRTDAFAELTAEARQAAHARLAHR